MFNNFFFFGNRAVYEIMWKNIAALDKPQYDACTFHAVYLRTHTHTHSEYVMLLLFCCNNGCTNAPQYSVRGTLPLFVLNFDHPNLCYEVYI